MTLRPYGQIDMIQMHWESIFVKEIVINIATKIDVLDTISYDLKMQRLDISNCCISVMSHARCNADLY